MTTAQLALDLSPLVEPVYEPEATLAERFAAFHAANPIVADVLEQMTAEWLAAGHERCGLKMIAETARWRTGLAMPGQAWKINNSFVAFYARLLIERHPDWSSAIETRVQRAAA